MTSAVVVPGSRVVEVVIAGPVVSAAVVPDDVVGSADVSGPVVCFGGELPPGCDMPRCENMTPCAVDDMGGSKCPDGSFCQTGCCELIVPG